MNNFTDESYAAFYEAATEKYDFATCQRGDGTYYGTGGTCRQGADVPGGVPKKEKAAGKASSGSSSSATAKASGGGGGKMSDADKKDLQIKASKGDKAAMKTLTDARAAGSIGKESKAAFGPGAKDKAGINEAKSARKEAKASGGSSSSSNTTQDGPKATASQRQQAMKSLRQERSRLENMQDEGKLSKAGEARLNQVKASQREYEIQGKQRSRSQTSDAAVKARQARSQAKASGEVADRKAVARKENEAKKAAKPRTDSKMSSKKAAEVKAAFDRKRQMKAGGQDGPKATTKQRAAAVENLSRQKNALLNKQDDNGRLSAADSQKLKLIEASIASYR